MSARRRRTCPDAKHIVVANDALLDRHEGNLRDYSDHTLRSGTLSNVNFYPESEIMTARDRTKEFSDAIKNMQLRQTAKSINIKDSRKSLYVQGHAQFMLNARTIGKNIAGTYSKLEKLTLLAKCRSLFEDRSIEIQELTFIIKEDLNSLNQQISQLQEIVKTQKKTQQNNRQHLVSHSSNVLLTLQSKLATMSTEFKQVLEVRTENLRQQKNRRECFSDSILPSSSISQSSLSSISQASLLLQGEQISIDLEPDRELKLFQNQKQVNYDETNSYLQSRAETMQNIESTIVELGGIYQQLAHMVKEQEEMVDRIDTNLESANLNVESAHGEILRYFQSVSSNRWLMIKVFGILIMFFIFFVIFVT